MLQIIEQETVRKGPRRLVVVIEGDSLEEVTGMDAKTMVLEYSEKQGLHRPGVSSGGGFYLVHREGDKVVPVTLENVKQAKSPRFRYDYEVQEML